MMRVILNWSVSNSPAVNTIALVILIVGGWCGISMQREFWPHAELDVVDVSVVYPGASPSEVETSICEKIEEATRNVSGVRRVDSVARTGRGRVSLQLRSTLSSVEADEAVNEIRNRVDAIATIPEQAERPVVRRRAQRTTSIQLGVVGRKDDSMEHQLRVFELAQRVRRELLLLPAVSDATIIGAPEIEINVELSEAVLRSHNLSLKQAADRIRQFSDEIPGGILQTPSEQVLLRGRRAGVTGSSLESVPLVASDAGAQRTIGQMCDVRDEFGDETRVSRINGRTGLAIRIDATKSDDILRVGQQVHQYVADRRMPEGFGLVTFLDRTDDVSGRLNLLAKNGWQALLIVFILLSLMMDFRLAIWVAAGIPIALAGACLVMYLRDQSLNMSSMFAFLIAIGIVVDDAIIVSENIFAHQQKGKSSSQAAIDGCLEVMPAVVTSVLTTSIAFLPILLMTGRAGRMTHVLPLAIISVLLFSLAEALIVLPCHLASKRIRSSFGDDASHSSGRLGNGGWIRRSIAWLFYPCTLIAKAWQPAAERVQSGLRFAATSIYEPVLRVCVRNAPMTFSISLVALMIAVTAVAKGTVPFSILPRMDWNFCTVLVKFPDGTPESVTMDATLRLEQAIDSIAAELSAEGDDAVAVVYRTVGFGTDNSGVLETGSHVGSLTLQLVDSSDRRITSQQIIQRWRQASGDISSASAIQFAAGPIGIESPPIEFTLMADKDDTDQLNASALRCLADLESLPGVYDVVSDQALGKSEYQIRLHPDAASSGVSTGQIARAIRAAVHGEEATRLQRGRHEVPIRVRYAKMNRRSLRDLYHVSVRMPDGHQLPVSELAQLQVGRGVSAIRRRDQMRAVTIQADVQGGQASPRKIAKMIQTNALGNLSAEYPGVRLVWGGQRAETRESMKQMRYGFIAVLLAMYVLLTIQFRSYVLPLLVLVIVPFSMIGAVLGHYLLGMHLTLFSIYGMVALAGIVVNDSIVLIDFVRQRIAAGCDVRDAIQSAGRSRFRPIMLTSITTVVCLLPIMSETSRQAQVLAPMAVSVAFGLVISTLFVLLLVPTIYQFLVWREKPVQVGEIAISRE